MSVCRSTLHSSISFRLSLIALASRNINCHGLVSRIDRIATMIVNTKCRDEHAMHFFFLFSENVCGQLRQEVMWPIKMNETKKKKVKMFYGGGTHATLRQMNKKNTYRI